MVKILKHLARILFGLVFIFSGFVKGIDPLGSTYKFTDYFHALGLDSLVWAAFPLGILLAFAEFAIGVAFLLNWRMKWFSWLGLLLWPFSHRLRCGSRLKTRLPIVAVLAMHLLSRTGKPSTKTCYSRHWPLLPYSTASGTRSR